MGKIKFSFIIMLLVCCGVNGQSYSFGVFNHSYAKLPNPVVLFADSDFNNLLDTAIVMPFQFQYFSQLVDTLRINEALLYFTKDRQDILSAADNTYVNLMDSANNTSLSYQLMGNLPNRKLVLQWNNVGFEDDEYESDWANFQVWFYEGTNIIEMHYGIINIDNPSSYGWGMDGMWVLFFDFDIQEPYALSGNPSQPSFSYFTSAYRGLNGHPSKNTVYQFSPKTSSVSSRISNDNITVGPVPCEGTLNIAGLPNDVASIKILTLDGKVVKYQAEQLYNSVAHLNISELSAGIYVLVIQSPSSVVSKKIIKI